MSAFRRLTEYEKGRITLLLNQIDPPSVTVISKRFGINPATIYKMKTVSSSGDRMDTGSRRIVVNAVNWFAYPGRDSGTKHVLYVEATGGSGTPIKTHEDIIQAAAGHGSTHVMFGTTSLPRKSVPLEKVTPKLTKILFQPRVLPKAYSPPAYSGPIPELDNP